MSQIRINDETNPYSLAPDPLIKDVTIYTDGACSGNPGPGGWAAILQFGDESSEMHERVLTGSNPETTNNRMELTAAVSALEALTEPCRARLHTDSAYLVNAFADGWLENWKKRGWKKANKKPVLNRDLWERLDDVTNRHDVRWIKVQGHAGVELNEAVDRLAVREIEKLREHERLLGE